MSCEVKDKRGSPYRESDRGIAASSNHALNCSFAVEHDRISSLSPLFDEASVSQLLFPFVPVFLCLDVGAWLC